MFATALEGIDFGKVEEFCKAFPEGVRVEYKAQPVQIPKIVSSFANTVGGIWVMGVETHASTNLPKLPLAGMPRRKGIEEQIVQACQSGIYPPATPGVKVLEVPGASGKVVIVVKVPESIEAPHAIENTTNEGLCACCQYDTAV